MPGMTVSPEEVARFDALAAALVGPGRPDATAAPDEPDAGGMDR